MKHGCCLPLLTPLLDSKRNETTEIAKESKKESHAKSVTKDVKTIDKTIHTITNSIANINSKSTDDGAKNEMEANVRQRKLKNG